MTDAPKRIWADPPETFDGMDVWRSEPGGKGVEYILASEHAALIQEAEARGRIAGLEDARNIASLNAWMHVGDDARSQGMDAGARHQSKVIHDALSEAINAAKDTP